MPKMDKDGREYIEQDGKRYYRNFWGEWEAEKDWLGNDKVETDWLGNPYVEPEKKDDSECYLTTACIRAMNESFDDNCYELTALRNFRDTFVKKAHPEAIQEYYIIAPKIVKSISARSDSQKIYCKIYEDLVIGTLRLLEADLPEEAYNL